MTLRALSVLTFCDSIYVINFDAQELQNLYSPKSPCVSVGCVILTATCANGVPQKVQCGEMYWHILSGS